jgi:hypothetical protein
MKKLFFFLSFSSLTLLGFSQELKENAIDEFTKQSVTRSSWVKLFANNVSTCHVRISKLDTTYYLDFKYMDNTVFQSTKVIH